MHGVRRGLLLITVLSVYRIAADEQRTATSTLDVAQIQNAFKLLQLQLKQTTESAEHIRSLLSHLDPQQSVEELHNGVPGAQTELRQPKFPSVQIDNPPAAGSSVAKLDQNAFTRTLAQRVTNWADDFMMLSAVKADSTVTAMTVLTYQPGALHNQFLVMGDISGKLYAFSTRGQLALEHDAGSSIQSLAASVRTQDKTVLLAGLANGDCQVLHLQLSNRHAHLQQKLHKESVQLLHPLSSAAHLEASSGGSPSNSKSSSSTDPKECDNTDVAEVHEGEQAGRGGGVTHVGLLRAGSARQVVAALADGQLLLYRENGTVGASGLSNQAVRALHVSGSSITLLSTHYLATAHVHGSQLRLRTRHLAGLNGSVIAAAAFDGQIQQRAYAVTTDLDLLLLHVPDPGTKQAKVLSRVQLSLAATGGPIQLTHMRGYLFLAAPTGLAIFNTTGFSNRRAPKMILAHPYNNVASAFAADHMVADVQVDPPLTAAQGALVAVSLGDGVVGLFESKLPFKESDKYPLHAMSRPLLILGMLLVGGWQYVRTKRKQDAQRSGKTPWPPDWGPGDASSFGEFPQLPKSRTQLVSPTKGAKARQGTNQTAAVHRPVARLQSDNQTASGRMSVEELQNISSANLDAMVFRQGPYHESVGRIGQE